MSTPEQPGPEQPSHGQAPYGQPSYGQQPQGSPDLYGQQPRAPFPQAPPMHPSANTSMVLGIVGLASVLLACGIGLFVSPVAWRMGVKAVREIDANPHQWRGRTEANSGRIMGLVGTILLGLALIGIILLVLALVATTSVSQEVVYDSEF